MKKMFAMLLALTMLATLIVGCGNTEEPAATTAAPAANNTTSVETVKEGKLTVAISPDFAPMEFVDPTKSGQDMFVGFDPMLANYIADELGLELVIMPMSFDACQTAVYTGIIARQSRYEDNRRSVTEHIAKIGSQQIVARRSSLDGFDVRLRTTVNPFLLLDNAHRPILLIHRIRGSDTATGYHFEFLALDALLGILANTATRHNGFDCAGCRSRLLRLFAGKI